jgi:hypothetical protein
MPDIVNSRDSYISYGYRTNLVGGIAAIDSEGNLDSNFLTFLDQIGVVSTLRAVSGTTIHFRFGVSPETLTGQPTSNENDGNSRMILTWGGNNTLRLGVGNSLSSHTGESRSASTFGSFGVAGASPAYVYAVGDSLGLAIFAIQQNGINSFADPVRYTFSYFGYCRNPAYGGLNYPLDYIAYMQDGQSGTRARRPSAVNSTQEGIDVYVEPSIVCDASNPSANTSDVIFRDVPSPNYAIGSARPFLLWTNQALIINTIHTVINKGNNPYLVVATAGTGRLLMPVWTELIV